jgi:hypothetical protein
MSDENRKPEIEGTEEMDRAALLRRLRGDKGGDDPHSTPTVRTAGPSTQHYQVPDSLLAQARDPYDDDDLPTSSFSMDELLEFEAVVDQHGRVALPGSAVAGRFGPGTVLKVIARPKDD